MIILNAFKIYQCTKAVLYFNVDKNNRIYLVTEEEGQLFLSIMENKELLNRIHLKAHSKKSHFYLVEAYKERIYVVSVEDYTCHLMTYETSDNRYQRICSFLLSVNVFHIDNKGILWGGLSDEGIFDDLNPKGQGIFAINLNSQKPLYDGIFTGKMYECYGLQSDDRHLYACYEDEDFITIGCYRFNQINQQQDRFVISTKAGINNYTYCDQIYISKDKILLANNHKGFLYAFTINGKMLEEVRIKIDGFVEKQVTYRIIGENLFILNDKQLYICNLK